MNQNRPRSSSLQSSDDFGFDCYLGRTLKLSLQRHIRIESRPVGARTALPSVHIGW